MEILIRTASISDAENLLNLRLLLDKETNLMLLEPNERSRSVEIQKSKLEDILSRNNSTVLLATCDNKIIGFLQARGGEFNRNKHSVDIVVGILQEHTGKGIGKKLFDEVEKWATDKKLRRLELTVMSHNKNAIKLYEKAGFTVEGRKKDALKIDNTYADEVVMGKVLEDK